MNMFEHGARPKRAEKWNGAAGVARDETSIEFEWNVDEQNAHGVH